MAGRLVPCSVWSVPETGCQSRLGGPEASWCSTTGPQHWQVPSLHHVAHTTAVQVPLEGCTRGTTAHKFVLSTGEDQRGHVERAQGQPAVARTANRGEGRSRDPQGPARSLEHRRHHGSWPAGQGSREKARPWPSPEQRAEKLGMVETESNQLSRGGAGADSGLALRTEAGRWPADCVREHLVWMQGTTAGGIWEEAGG